MKFLFLFGLIGSLVGRKLCASASEAKKADNLDYRLNTDIEPIDYIIELTPYLTNDTGKIFTFDGSVTITLRPTKADVNTITLHKEDLEITKQTLTPKADIFLGFGWNLQDTNFNLNHSEYDSRTNKYSIILAKSLDQTKSYELKLKFSGKLRTDMLGFYRSSYKNGDETKWLASTKFEPGHARKAFPCFDEPRFKATFTIIINRPSNFKPSLSNTPLQSSMPHFSADLVREVFKKTPKMSTYLVALVVSEFECRENAAKTFGVCSRPNAYNQTEYSFDVGQKTLAKYDELFDYPYNSQMDKLHMIAIPDFVSGAMENWGLVTYRETALLYDPNVSTSMAKQRVGSVVAHEQAHMWFGDLVTCDWWSNLFLNEGFARYFQYFALLLTENSWSLEQQFTVNEMQTVFGADSLEDSHALTHDVNSPDEISERFDSISYSKGAAIIRMVQYTIGNDKFIAALKNYLKTNELSTAVPEKLYAALQQEVASDLNVTTFCSGWVAQPGYPVLNVNVSSDRKTAVLTQRKFLRNKPEHNDKTLWSIPITFASNKENSFNETTTNTFLTDESLKISLGSNAVDWIVFNKQQTGYYRVNYDDATWSAIDRVLYETPTSIHVLNRAQIVDDALNLARGNQLKYTQALHTVQYLRNETDYVPWQAALSNFNFILARFKNDEATVFKKFVLDLLSKVYEHLGFHPKNTDTHLDVYNRNIILRNACKLGHEQCVKDARAEYDKLLQKNYQIPVNLVPVVYCSVVSEGADAEWEYLWEKFESENVAAEQVTILNALGCTKQANLISKYLELILSDSIRLQDKHSALVSTLTQQENVDLVIDFIIANHENITNIFETPKEVPKILTTAADWSTTDEQVNKITNFVEQHKLDSNKNLRTALKNAKYNLKWSEKNVPIIKENVQRLNNPNSATIQTTSLAVLFGMVLISMLITN